MKKYLPLLLASCLLSSCNQSKDPISVENTKHHGKVLHLALTSFAKDNDGHLPCDMTSMNNESGVYSDDHLKQLLEAALLEDEMPFYHAVIPNTSVPDLDGNLKKGENDWGYVSGLTNTSPNKTPLIFIPASGPGTFDPKPWDGQAIVVTMDGTVNAYPIQQDGTIRFTDSDGNEYNPFDEDHLPSDSEILLPASL